MPGIALFLPNSVKIFWGRTLRPPLSYNFNTAIEHNHIAWYSLIKSALDYKPLPIYNTISCALTPLWPFFFFFFLLFTFWEKILCPPPPTFRCRATPLEYIIKHLLLSIKSSGTDNIWMIMQCRYFLVSSSSKISWVLCMNIYDYERLHSFAFSQSNSP